MDNHQQYTQAREAISNLIRSKEEEVQILEQETAKLKCTRRLLDEEHVRRLNEKPKHLG